MNVDLERLERPRFSRGMVLSDNDLTALVEWTRGRLGLQRYHDGWGVACGLDVRCVPGRPGTVKILSGYGVSPAGADLVVTAPIETDLSRCAEPCHGDLPSPPQPCGDVVVDLYLDAAESDAVPELLKSCGCDDDHVTTTRVCEGVAVRSRVVPWAPDMPDPLFEAAKAWQLKYHECHDVVRRFVDEGVASSGSSGIVHWLSREAGDAPCDWLPRLRTTNEPDAVQALLDLVVFRRHRLLRTGCEECTTGEGVRLARIWLRRSDDADGRPGCAVTLIDAYPPYRRELGPTPPHPVAPGQVGLTSYVWQRWDQVRARWHGLTGQVDATIFDPGETASALLTLLDASDLIAWEPSADPPTPILVATPCLGIRVLGFHSAPRKVFEPSAESPPSPEPPPSPATEPGLEEIRGVGPKTAAALRGVGISTPRAVVTASIERLSPLMPPATDPAEVQEDAQRLLGRPS
uniref:helix-hairpin-helix domain-containing protein n=1 Tax=Paractinoplanes polyasparticus TaxID=2856853 RepID=UPI001C857FCA|nr:helix-hairpin-helix domain-containing protein [Actinoplanes polyasparticus]